MNLHFIKMHGLGNDYVYIDCFQRETAEKIAQLDLCELAQRLSRRHTGIGSDGVVLIMPSRVADVRMRMFNADGSEAEMCGNAARCIAKYAYENKLCGNPMTIETLSGIKTAILQLSPKDCVESVTLEIGATIGNPHEVFFVETPEALDAQFEHLLTHSQYKELRARTNIECAYVNSPHDLTMRVCERGTGETMACGTGACAAAIAAMERGLTANQVTVHLPGGELLVRRDDKGCIYLTGPATTVFKGDYLLEE